MITTSDGNLTDKAPTCYQEIDGEKVAVAGKYSVTDDTHVVFSLENYDVNQSLVIDPQLSYSTYLGGTSFDYGRDIAVGNDYSIYIAGVTQSEEFVSGEPIQPYAGVLDSFVAKINPAGDELVFLAYIGGDDEDQCKGIVVDDDGYSYIVGYTTSSDYPTNNAVQPDYAGDTDAFITQISPDGSSLPFSSYLGGTIKDYGYGIAHGSEGSVYVVGETNSNDYPTSYAFQSVKSGGYDGFLARIDYDIPLLVYSTYLGGSNGDAAHAVFVGEYDCPFVVGDTQSTNFPTVSPLQSSCGGNWDAFVAKFLFNGSSLIYSTYLGGNGWDNSRSIVVDDDGCAYVTGYTSSTNFPTINQSQDTLAGGNDAFVTKINADGSELVYSTYLGGSGNEIGQDIALGSDDSVYITGETDSTNFPTTEAFQEDNAGLSDAFVTKIEPESSSLIFSSYLGGSGQDIASGIFVDDQGCAYIAGSTSSTDFPTVNPLQATTTNPTCFVAKIADENDPPNSPPNTPEKPNGPETGFCNIAYEFSTSTIDPDDEQVNYTFDWNDGCTTTTELIDSGTVVQAVHSWEEAGTYQINVKAEDESGLESDQSDDANITIEENQAPEVPSMPSGSYSVSKGKSYTYSTTSTDADGDKLKIVIDWGDGTTDESAYVKSESKVKMAHIWLTSGQYDLSAKAVDEHGAESDWSKVVTVVNKPPSKPSTPSGPSKGVVNAVYTYTMSSKDPEKDQIKMQVDWGDLNVEESDWVDSGTKVSMIHYWSASGTYLVKVRALDAEDSASAWSSTKKVVISEGT